MATRCSTTEEALLAQIKIQTSQTPISETKDEKKNLFTHSKQQKISILVKDKLLLTDCWNEYWRPLKTVHVIIATPTIKGEILFWNSKCIWTCWINLPIWIWWWGHCRKSFNLDLFTKDQLHKIKQIKITEIFPLLRPLLEWESKRSLNLPEYDHLYLKQRVSHSSRGGLTLS